MNTEKVETNEYLKDVILGGRQYCLKEPLSTLPKARMQLKAYVNEFVRNDRKYSNIVLYKFISAYMFWIV